LVSYDVGGNITRLSERAEATGVAELFQLINDEMAQGTHAGTKSCARGLLWLNRAMIFVTELLKLLCTDLEMTLSAAASQAYGATLQQYHGLIVKTTFTVAMKLVPSR
jgi:hypothetical protein